MIISNEDHLFKHAYISHTVGQPVIMVILSSSFYKPIDEVDDSTLRP